jgi:hypothetical protein
MAIKHEGNQSSSPEEAEQIRELVTEILTADTTGSFEAECRTPRQMEMANAFCRYVEMTQTLAAAAE